MSGAESNTSQDCPTFLSAEDKLAWYKSETSRTLNETAQLKRDIEATTFKIAQAEEEKRIQESELSVLMEESSTLKAEEVKLRAEHDDLVSANANIRAKIEEMKSKIASLQTTMGATEAETLRADHCDHESY